MKKLLCFSLSLSLFISPITAFSQNQDLAAQKALAISVAPIKSASDLSNYVKMTPKTQSSLKYLSASDQRFFLASLTFNEKGLTGFDYGVLKKSLSAKQIAEVLSLFGYQHLTNQISGQKSASVAFAPVDYVDYRCESRATCETAMSKICTSNC